MPEVENARLTLTTVDNEDTTIRVTYTAVFSEFERNLAGLGMKYHHHINVLGVDPSGSTTGDNLANFPKVGFAVTAGTGEQRISRDHELTVERSVLQEDTGTDTDEIRCKVRIHAVGLPDPFTPDVFTEQETIGG
jgi:hypothetical protein